MLIVMQKSFQFCIPRLKTRQLVLPYQAYRKRGGPGGGKCPPVFARSVNPISNRGGILSPPSTTCPPPWIFRPCDGPAYGQKLKRLKDSMYLYPPQQNGLHSTYHQLYCDLAKWCLGAGILRFLINALLRTFKQHLGEKRKCMRDFLFIRWKKK